MARPYTTSGLLFAFLLLVCGNPTLANDTVILKSGRILRGKVKEGEADKGGTFVLLKSDTGATYKLDKGDIVKTILLREQADIDYEKRLKRVRDIATDHVEIAKWCQKQSRGRTRFKEQIRWHYENVIRLDPDHSQARKNLGYMKLEDGSWVVRAVYASRQGYVPDRKRDWVAKLSKEVAANDEEFDAKLGAKKKEFNKWLSGAKRGRLNPGVLANICDHSTLWLVYESAVKSEANLELTRVHLDAIAKVRSRLAIRILSQFAMMAANQNLREHAISLLSQPEIDHVLAVNTLAEGLVVSSRATVHNAAFAIAEVALTDEFSRDSAVIPLAESLNTQHEEKIQGALEAGRLNTAFGNGGTGFQTGGGPQTQLVNYRNEPSLSALRRLFESDFGYNEQAWKDWYIQNFTLQDLTVRGEE